MGVPVYQTIGQRARSTSKDCSTEGRTSLRPWKHDWKPDGLQNCCGICDRPGVPVSAFYSSKQGLGSATICHHSCYFSGSAQTRTSPALAYSDFASCSHLADLRRDSMREHSIWLDHTYRRLPTRSVGCADPTPCRGLHCVTTSEA